MMRSFIDKVLSGDDGKFEIIGAAIAGGSLIAKGIAEYNKPDSDIYKDFPSFEDNPALMGALQDAQSRSRDPGVYEQAVRSTGRQFGPIYARQVESIRQAYGNKPALFNRALQRVQENYANTVRTSLDKALIREEEAKESARGEVTQLGQLKFQSDRELALARGEAEQADKMKMFNFFGDLFDETADIGVNIFGRGLDLGGNDNDDEG